VADSRTPEDTGDGGGHERPMLPQASEDELHDAIVNAADELEHGVHA
jgi:hypothetical protein